MAEGRTRIGDLRHRVIIQSSTETADAHGQMIPTWTDEAKVSASVEPLTQRELFQAGQVNSNINHRVLMRHRDGMTTKKRILFGSRTFNIESALNPEERNKELVLLCSEVT